MMTHLGSSMFPYFLRWVQDENGGNGGSDWTERHIASFVNIAGPMVGVPKALTAMLSGETRDTMSLGSFGAYLLEKFFSRRERASLMRTWAGGSSMLPKGGNLIWGHREKAPDDEENSKHHSYGNIISFTKKKKAEEDSGSNTTEKVVDEDVVNNFSVNDSLDLLYQTATGEYTQMLASNYSLGISTSKQELEKNNKDHRKWSNPLESQLPIAPSMKIYCMYGVGLPTERSYYYTRAQDDVQQNQAADTLKDDDISLLFNGTDIQQEEFMDAVVKKSINKEEKEELPQPPLIVISSRVILVVLVYKLNLIIS
jgi:phospholipid:diacylglycerol acyltransferase